MSHLSTSATSDRFAARHSGLAPADVQAMLAAVGYQTLDAFLDAVVPGDIRLRKPLAIPAARSEHEVLAELRSLASRNQVFRSYLGMGYHDTLVPPVLQRNIVENPGWYTSYTPYQAEISQGRLEALLNYQTMVADLTGLEIANASLLDEATACAEAMHMTHAAVKKTSGRTVYLVDEACHPQNIAVVKTRAGVQGVEIQVGNPDTFAFGGDVIGALVQYPATDGRIRDFAALAAKAHAAGTVVTAATDLLALALIQPPGAWGADIAVGNTQRFGVPLGYGGPHAAFFATRDAFKRLIPGRIIGVSKDKSGRMALRMALGTREQHIRREKATSNICTAQVLLAVLAGMYAVWHGPEGIRAIAAKVHGQARRLAAGLRGLGYALAHEAYFDTLAVTVAGAEQARVLDLARQHRINLRKLSPSCLTVALDETVTEADLVELMDVFATAKGRQAAQLPADGGQAIPKGLARTTPFLAHPVFSRYHSETEMLRYLKKLEDKDLSLTTAMIPLGSCTLKLNATAEMIPITWPEFNAIHPFAPREQTAGYQELFQHLEKWLNEITGFAATSFQPNAGSQGEFTGLLTIRAYQKANGQGHRKTCLIPASAHGTNPASAVMAGMDVVVVKTNDKGEIDLADLTARADEHKDTLSALMVTYPSTHGVFEPTIKDVCRIVHERGGQVYMDGANMNAQVGLSRPGDIGADVCHLNLHKTFAIPHGGGGPGMGPICVARHLVPFLPTHPVIDLGHAQSCGTVAAAPWGSASILPISFAYIAMLGPDGVKEATAHAILAANYVAKRLAQHYPTLYTGPHGLVAHECILDTRGFKASANLEVIDIAKRIIDYGFHPPTVAFPVHGTLMVEPTESESKAELDRFVDALIAIRGEIAEIEQGKAKQDDNIIVNAPHPLADLLVDDWKRPYSREKAGYPTQATREHKVWPTVSRIDDAWGDRNLMCVCPPVESYAKT